MILISLTARSIERAVTDQPELPVDRQWLCERIVDQAGEAVLFVDTDEGILLWNDAAAEIFGYSRAEALGRQLDIIIPDEFIDAHRRGFENALARGEVTSPPVTRTQVPALRKDGQRITIETSGARVVTDESGDVVGVFNLIRDVTNTDR